MRHKNQLVACIVTGTAMFTLAAGAGSMASAAPAPAATASIPSVSMFGQMPESVANLSTNTFTKFAEKLSGLTFTFQTTPVADATDLTTKQGLLLASGQYPDVIWGGSISNADALKYGSEGVFLPLQNLIKKYAPNLWNNIQTIPGYKQAVTAPNGDIYSLPAYNYCPHCSWTYEDYINIDYLNKFGLSMPRTTAEFANVLNVFKQHGLTPLSGAIDTYDSNPVQFLMNSFIPFDGDLATTTDENYVDVSNSGSVIFVPTQPQWKAGLEYIYSLFKNGDFTAEALTQQPSALTSQISQNTLGVFPSGADEVNIQNYGASSSNYLEWLAMPPLKGPSGADYTAFGGTGIGPGFVMAITSKASMAQEIGIMKLLNYMNTAQGFLNYNLGCYVAKPTPGSTGLAPGAAIFTIKDESVAFVTPNFYQNCSWFQWGPFFDGTSTRMLQESPPPFTPDGSQSYNQLTTEIDMAGHQAKLQYPSSVWVPTADGASFGTLQTNIDTYVDQWTDEFITGQKSLTSDWNSYVSGLNHLGMSSYMGDVTKIMGAPLNTDVPLYQSSPSDIKFLLCKGPVPSLTKKYLIESGVPASDFNCAS